MEVTLMDMLEARERRAYRQQALLEEFGSTLICFTMNIAGPEKDSPLIQRGFLLGQQLLEGQLQSAGLTIRHRELLQANTGWEGMYVLSAPPLQIKALTAEIEDATPAGRLYDMDVLCPDGRKVDRQELGLPGRQCLICGGSAKACARSRSHTVPQLQERTRQILTQALAEQDSRHIARLACQALLYEAATTPKPGLVDRANSGSHRDMDIFSFQASAAALWPYFARCAQIGIETAAQSPEATFDALRLPGRLAEAQMRQATGGVNTHKGAIFSLGIACAALGRLPVAHWSSPERILEECAAMTRGLVARDYAGLTEETAQTTGHKLYLRHGITGVRGQAEAGFPVVLKYGLPKLEQGLALGKSMDLSGCAALLAMLAHTADTNLIHRGSYALQAEISAQLETVLEKSPFPDEATLRELDLQFTEKNLSPGGTADLLALVYLLHFIKEEAHV